MIDLAHPVAVVCHDAGATNLILPWITEDVLPVMAGPAARLWQRRFGDRPTVSLDDALAQASSVLSGTGWASDLEHRARRVARQRRLHSAAVIDHWVNYRERFVRDDEEILPEELWVTDDDAEAIARSTFPALSVRRKPNDYLREQLATAPALQPTDQDVLLIAEPARSDWGRSSPGEFQALDYALERRSALGIAADAGVRLRPHPADPAGKYDAWLADHPDVHLDRSSDLGSALAGVRWVIGCESYALVVAAEAGRMASSALPPWAPPCRLPQPNITRLATL